jgi:hypothetical protein
MTNHACRTRNVCNGSKADIRLKASLLAWSGEKGIPMRLMLSVGVLLSLGACAAAPRLRQVSSPLIAAERLIDAFYSFDPAQLRTAMADAPRLRARLRPIGPTARPFARGHTWQLMSAMGRKRTIGTMLDLGGKRAVRCLSECGIYSD